MSGTQKQKLTGKIKFNDLSFIYPTRPGQKVIDNLNIEIKPNQITAIVGDSGAGKSTISNLLMRIYDPNEG